MARMHSRKHGKHGSKKPAKKKLDWLGYDKDEGKNLVKKLEKEGKTSSEIGMILRDQYGIPDARSLGLRVSKVMQKKEITEDMYNLMKKVVNLHRHLQENKGDSKSKHGLELAESKIRRLGKYYSRKGRLPRDWKYSIEKAKLLVK